jgi:hypothetical protein
MMSVPPEIDCTGKGFRRIANPSELPVAQDRSGREHHPERAEIERTARAQSRFLADLEVGRVGTERRHSFTGDELPKGCRLVDRSVVEDDLHTRGKCRKLPVPHHPGAGRLEEELVAPSQIAVKSMLLHMLEQGAAGTVHQALWPAGGA